jgi:eukaryotic-like serine/threonine-protein kinase
LTDSNLAGVVLDGRYRLTRRIASGGMGAIYEGEHLANREDVAIKVLGGEQAREGRALRRFRRECAITRSLSSPHIVRVLDVGSDPDHGFFMVMERLEGENLATRLELEGRLPGTEACEIAHQAALGLEEAHAAKILHRDLKPSNLFLVKTCDGAQVAKILDFGVAKAFAGVVLPEESPSTVTRAGFTVGTPQYMSPEQAVGFDDLDERADIYALGAVLFETLVGLPCMQDCGSCGETLRALLRTPAPRLCTRLRDVDPRLDDLVAQMLRIERTERPRTMREVRVRLGEILSLKCGG